MKTRVLCLFAAGLLASGCLFAQSPVNLEVTVPFSFQIGAAVYPAGEYGVARMDGNPAALMLKSKEGKGGAIALSQPVYQSTKRTTAKLIFSRYAGTHFLSEVWGPFGAGNLMRVSREEKEFASRITQPTERTVVAARSK